MGYFISNLFFVAVLLSCPIIGSCYPPYTRLLESSLYPEDDSSDWPEAVGTWYGASDGAGSSGGSCGYHDSVSGSKFHSMITAVSPKLYDNGYGCGQCYQVKCTQNTYCSGNAVTVAITDECPGCGDPHFDLSGTAFGSLATSGSEASLRNAGQITIEYNKVDCQYDNGDDNGYANSSGVAFIIDQGSNQYYIAFTIEYVNGPGISEVKIAESGSSYVSMQQSWGSVWKYQSDSGNPLAAPFTVLLENNDQQTLEIQSAIPAGWLPGRTYQTASNFT